MQITTSGDANPDLGIIPATGVGSGVIYDPAGWILTNRHVIEGSDTMKVELNDGRSFTGSVYGIDTLTDLAIVKIDGTDLPAAALGQSDSLKVGQLVIAVLDQVIYLVDTEDAVAVGLTVEIDAPVLRVAMPVVDLADVEIIGSAPKAVALSELRMEHAEGRWIASAIVDV